MFRRCARLVSFCKEYLLKEESDRRRLIKKGLDLFWHEKRAYIDEVSLRAMWCVSGYQVGNTGGVGGLSPSPTLRHTVEPHLSETKI